MLSIWQDRSGGDGGRPWLYRSPWCGRRCQCRSIPPVSTRVLAYAWRTLPQTRSSQPACTLPRRCLPRLFFTPFVSAPPLGICCVISPSLEPSCEPELNLGCSIAWNCSSIGVVKTPYELHRENAMKRYTHVALSFACSGSPGSCSGSRQGQLLFNPVRIFFYIHVDYQLGLLS